jgi:hypothetical protein
VADARLGLDDRWVAELAPQAADGDEDGVGERVGVLAHACSRRSSAVRNAGLARMRASRTANSFADRSSGRLRVPVKGSAVGRAEWPR